jgi:hypothetical protein
MSFKNSLKPSVILPKTNPTIMTSQDRRESTVRALDLQIKMVNIDQQKADWKTFFPHAKKCPARWYAYVEDSGQWSCSLRVGNVRCNINGDLWFDCGTSLADVIAWFNMIKADVIKGDFDDELAEAATKDKQSKVKKSGQPKLTLAQLTEDDEAA